MLICQSCLIVSGKARIAFQRVWLAECNSFEDRGVLLSKRLSDVQFCITSFKSCRDLAVLVAVMECAVSDLY